jgi:integrase/recombinase XerD
MAGRVVSPPKRVVWSGPLSEYGAGFVAEVQRLGFTPLSVEHQSRLFAHLSRWMQSQGLEVGQLTSARVDEFLVERRATHTNRYSRKSLRTLLGFLNLPTIAPSTPATSRPHYGDRAPAAAAAAACHA